MKVAGKISSITAQQNPTRGLTFAFNQISKQVLQFFFCLFQNIFFQLAQNLFPKLMVIIFSICITCKEKVILAQICQEIIGLEYHLQSELSKLTCFIKQHFLPQSAGGTLTYLHIWVSTHVEKANVKSRAEHHFQTSQPGWTLCNLHKCLVSVLTLLNPCFSQ